MTPVTAAKVKYGVWGLILGGVLATIIGFAWGGWTTASTTQRLGEEAVLERVKKGAAGHFSRGLSTDECFDFPQKAIQENGTISSHQGLF